MNRSGTSTARTSHHINLLRQFLLVAPRPPQDMVPGNSSTARGGNATGAQTEAKRGTGGAT